MQKWKKFSHDVLTLLFVTSEFDSSVEVGLNASNLNPYSASLYGKRAASNLKNVFHGFKIKWGRVNDNHLFLFWENYPFNDDGSELCVLNLQCFTFEPWLGKIWTKPIFEL